MTKMFGIICLISHGLQQIRLNSLYRSAHRALVHQHRLWKWTIFLWCQTHTKLEITVRVSEGYSPQAHDDPEESVSSFFHTLRAREQMRGVPREEKIAHHATPTYLFPVQVATPQKKIMLLYDKVAGRYNMPSFLHVFCVFLGFYAGVCMVAKKSHICVVSR